jgi:hypothetical protein
VASPISDRRKRSNDSGARDATDDEAIAQADARPVAVSLGFDALDVREGDLLLLKSDLGAASWIASRDLLQVVAEYLGTQPGGYVTLRHLDFRIVHDRNRTVSSAEDLQREANKLCVVARVSSIREREAAFQSGSRVVAEVAGTFKNPPDVGPVPCGTNPSPDRNARAGARAARRGVAPHTPVPRDLPPSLVKDVQYSIDVCGSIEVDQLRSG